MKVNLLIKIQIGIRPLTFPGKTCVKNPTAVCVPGCAAACSGILDMRNRVRQRFARRGFVKVKCAVLATAFGKGDGEVFAVQRRHKPVDGSRAFRVENVRIEHYFFRLKIVRRCERHQQRLLLRRLELHRE